MYKITGLNCKAKFKNSIQIWKANISSHPIHGANMICYCHRKTNDLVFESTKINW